MLLRSATLLGLLFLGAGVPEAAERALPLTDPAWALEGEGTRVVRDNGRDVLEVRSGFAYRRDVRLRDGRIDFEVQLTSRRSFVYCAFRLEADEEGEEIYLRPHKSGLPDAVQYAPVYQGRSGWQLYHGPGKTAAPTFTPGKWTRVRLLLKDGIGVLFIDDLSKPALVMRLARTPRAGYLALRGFLPADVPGDGPIARFANVVIDDSTTTIDATPPSLDPPHPGTVRAWAVSAVLAPSPDSGVPALPPAAALGTLTPIEAQADGLLELHQHVRIPPKTRATAAVARIHVRASRTGVQVFDLGFSDIATVFVNGAPVFRGDGTYSFDRPRREGLIGYDQARLYLPLIEGDNEIAVHVSDVFGGWAVMGRFASPQGLEVSAR